MKKIVLFATLIGCAVPTAIAAQSCLRDSTTTLSDKDIAEAITLGRSNAKWRPYDSTDEPLTPTRLGFLGLKMTFPRTSYSRANGPYGRVVAASQAAAEKYLPFNRENVDSILLSPLIGVMVTPVAPRALDYSISPSRGIDWTPVKNITHIVLMSISGNDTTVVQPIHIDFESVEYSNLMGGSMSIIHANAQFCISDIPKGDFNITAISNIGPLVYPVTAKHRNLIR